MAIASRLDSSGNFYIQPTGVFDEVTIVPVIYGGLTLTYTFTSGVATASFGGKTIVGNPGSGQNGGGTYSITGTATVVGTIATGGANGGAGGNGATTGLSGGGGGGAIGGNKGGDDTNGNAGTPATHTDVSGLFAAVTGSGQSSSVFGNGNQFAGGGGTGGSATTPSIPSSGGNAAIVFQYQISGTNYFQLINSSSGNGSFTFPSLTNYVKIWAIGQGATGQVGSGSGPFSGWGGHAGGVGYGVFDGTSLTYSPSASLLDSSGDCFIPTSGMFDEITIHPISGGIARRQDSSGNYYIAGIFDETTPMGTTNSVLFNGTNQYLTVPANTNLVLSGSSYTVEWWMYPLLVNGTQQDLIDKNTAGNYAYTFRMETDNTLTFYTDTPSVGSNLKTAALVANTWYHIAATYDGTTTRLFLNGSLSASNNTTFAINAAYDTSQTLYIGARSYLSSMLYKGYISNIRIVKGTALYTSAFTPSTTPLTAVSGTQLLTCQSPTIIDNSVNAFTITNNGTANVSYIAPF